ncbi:esterase FE4-like [Pectinophora gossypiella]|uniref:esterase FE4-like n=1 Tax=Pectinophora gossypiella TaxID=13191 RepID=UPI00214F318D|nr:esterase FE4-like [Pectinophora gossypiella]
MQQSLLILWLYILHTEVVWCIFTPVIQIEQGRVRGVRSVSGQNRYYGIPYAVSERFQPPQEPPQWDGVYTAVSRLRHCAQTVSFFTTTNEDCLHLDVYSPETARTADRLPVLVFIHGGGYYYGTKAHYDPEFLVTKNVVVVVINYRLGVFGFLCANGIANLGLKDQVAALRWIKKNIAAFGGDPDNVTISGQSAGASAAAMHMLSRASKGLFHKAILMSGTSLTPWAFNVEPLRPAFEDAAKLGRVKTEKDVFDIFSNSSVEDILPTCADVSTNTRYFKYAPCVDSDTADPFFHDTPHNIIKSGDFNKVPTIIGFANVEGMLFYGINNDRSFKDLNDNFIDKLPSIFSWQSKKIRRSLAKKIRSHYFGKKRIDRAAVRGVVDYYSDWLVYGTNEAYIELMKKHSDAPIYSYMFAYEGGRNFAKFLFGGSTGLDGASHSDDIFYIFKPGGLSLLLSAADRLFIDRLTTMITNFMKYGDPTPTKTTLLPVRWPAHDNSSRLLRLDRQFVVEETQHTHRGRFLLDVICSYGHPGHVPCENTRQ